MVFRRERRNALMSGTDDLSEIKAGIREVMTTQKHHGELLEKIDRRYDGLDERLRAVENKSAIYGGVSGGVISVAIGFITAKLTGKI